MAIVLTDNTHYKAIADKIRELSRTYEEYDTFTPSQLAASIGIVYKSGITRGKTDGKIELLQSSTHMNATTSGAVAVANDVSPIEHDVAVQLSSDTITDFSAVTVKRYGKNLFENNADKVSNISFTSSSGATTSKYYGYAVPLCAGTYTIHAEGTVADDYVYGVLNTDNGEYVQNVRPVSSAILGTVTFTASENCVLYIYNAGAGNNNINTSKSVLAKYNIQLEVGSTATPYMPFIEPTTYTVNTDGTVDGMKSLSPSMTLITDTDGVTIDGSYLRDIDTYIDNLTMSVAMTGGD